MKKFIALTLALALLASLSFAVAGAPGDDLGIQIIGGPEAESVPMSLDDMQLGTTYTIDGYAKVLPRECKMVDCFAQFGETEDYSASYGHGYGSYTSYDTVFSYSNEADFDKNHSSVYNDAAWNDSGESAQFIWFLVDVTNLQKKPVEFLEDASIKVVYQDDYEFEGWTRQIVYDHREKQYSDGGVTRYGFDKDDYPNEIVMNPAKVEPIDMMYTGTYVFGCTVPNTVVEDKTSPLRMEIKLGENDLTYNIRK